MPDDRIAPDGKLWVCTACGKTAKNRHGPPNADQGWDESCVLNSHLFNKDELIFNEQGRVVAISEGDKE